MLRIRTEQMAVFTEDARRKSEEKLLHHCTSCWPEKTAKLGEGGTAALIQRTIQAVAPHGITAQADLARYLNLIFVWGEGFESRLPWVSEILNDPTLRGPVKVFQLVHRTREELKAIGNADSRRGAV